MPTERYTRIRSNQIIDILPDDINAINPSGLIDGYIPSYDSATGQFEWIANTTVPCADVNILTLGSPTWTTQCQFNNLFGSAGQATGGVISDAGGETVNVTAGTGFIKATDSDTANLLSFDWAESLAIAIPTDSTRYIGVKYDSGTPVVDIREDQDWDYDTEFPLGSVINLNGILYILNNPWWVTDGMTNAIEKSIALGGYLARDNFVGGLILGVDGTRNPNMTAGVIWGRMNEFNMKSIDLSTAVVASHSAIFDVDNGSSKGTITASAGTPYTNLHGGQRVIITGTGDNDGTYRIDTVVGGNVITMETVIAGTDGTEASTVLTGTLSTYWFESDGTVHETTGLTQYPITQWNDVDNDQLDTIDNNKYANWWVMLNVTSNELSFIYPQATFSNSASAEAEEIPSNIPSDWFLSGVLIGRILFKQGVDAPVEVQSTFTTVFNAQQASVHNNLSGLQGGDTSEYYHLDSAEHTELHAWLDDVTLSDGGSIDLGTGTITVNSIEIVGADGEVNKSAVEDSSNWDSAYSHISNNGSDHSYIDQDVTSTGTPSFTSLTLENGAVFANAVDKYVTLTENSDILTWYFSGTDIYQRFSDGSLIFQTDEGTNTATIIGIKGKGYGIDGAYAELLLQNNTTFLNVVALNSANGIITDSTNTFTLWSQPFEDRGTISNLTEMLTASAVNGNITINATAVSAHYDLMLAGDGVLGLKETATPTADTGYGKIYCKDDNKAYFQDGAGVEKELLTDAEINNEQITFTIDGGGSVITTGYKTWIPAPFDCTITGYEITADQSTTTEIDVLKATYANFPPTNGSGGDSICEGHEPVVTAGIKSQDLDLGDWTSVAVTKGDYIRIYVNENDNATRIVLRLIVTVASA